MDIIKNEINFDEAFLLNQEQEDLVNNLIKIKSKKVTILNLFHIMKRKTQKKKSKSKIAKLFFSYSTNNQYLTKRQIIRLMKIVI